MGVPWGMALMWTCRIKCHRQSLRLLCHIRHDMAIISADVPSCAPYDKQRCHMVRLLASHAISSTIWHFQPPYRAQPDTNQLFLAISWLVRHQTRRFPPYRACRLTANMPVAPYRILFGNTFATSLHDAFLAHHPPVHHTASPLPT